MVLPHLYNMASDAPPLPSTFAVDGAVDAEVAEALIEDAREYLRRAMQTQEGAAARRDAAAARLGELISRPPLDIITKQVSAILYLRF